MSSQSDQSTGIKWRHDVVLIGIMATLAGCGIIYEYLLAHYASRVMGATESTIYAMIGLMIVSMGIGAFLARWIKNPFDGFALLEVSIGFIGGLSVLMMAALVGLTFTIPTWLHQVYGLHPSITTDGVVVVSLQKVAKVFPFVLGFVLGIMIGMEIPLIARVREKIYQRHLEHNTGIIYGADYIGAGIGAAIWVLVCLQSPVVFTAIFTALINVLIGFVFLIRYRGFVKRKKPLYWAHGVLVLTLLFVSFNASVWMEKMNQALFKDQIVYTKNTPFQQLVITERIVGAGLPIVTSLNINGRLQFSSNDERIYHSYLTHPALLASARTDNILIIGGGDGLALRDVFRWNPSQVTLIDLDPAMITLFQGKDTDAPSQVSQTLVSLNENSLNDPRLKIITGDAFNVVEAMVSRGQHFDSIIVDLPDPSHPDLNKLYSDYFYSRLKNLLSGDGAIVIQSTSPYHATEAFLSIGKTLSSAGFQTEQYHANVPSFGEWGWTIGTPYGSAASKRIAQFSQLPIEDDQLSIPQIQAAFIFSPAFMKRNKDININRLGSHQLYRYHQEAWSKRDSVYFSEIKD